MIAPVSSSAFQRYQTSNQSTSYRDFGVRKTTHAGGVGRETGGNLKYGNLNLKYENPKLKPTQKLNPKLKPNPNPNPKPASNRDRARGRYCALRTRTTDRFKRTPRRWAYETPDTGLGMLPPASRRLARRFRR